MSILQLPIVSVRRETPRNRLIRIDLQGHPFPFHAGQYALLGQHGQEQRKPYSIASAPTQAATMGFLEFLIQVDEGESPGSHLPRLETGRLLDVQGPAGSFFLPHPSPQVLLLVGGGTGVAPLRSMVWQALSSPGGARVALLQSARTPDELSFSTEFRALAKTGRVKLLETVTRHAPVSWPGARGRINPGQLSTLLEGHCDAMCFVCGPASLVEDVPRQLQDLGVDPSRILTEQWAEPASNA